MTYDELLVESEYEGVKVLEKPLKYGFKGLYKNRKIIIDNKLNQYEKNCILSEELGHFHTTYGNIIDQTDVKNIKQEKIARNWGYEKLIGIVDIVTAFEKGIRSKHELAEHLNVTEQFIDKAINHYREKYGLYAEIDNYIVYFEPNLMVLKMF
ncbi:ImmA/IrrE family metallo-endopeptidase [Clostridium sp. 19966]|uniref:ImmA/IrrE family metallo-endopeptidase n=1 Tax=Clostridium sp. 19966 TaxID=2768166 RepID=UPI0028DE81E0|nr:ImmA/IrrE family metallo-endopeptidase [Clostridium sp. 19966]MDT8715472.1 ImmA/IrrE family metallo-endopeptidase [Clostridium sp. 19966]